MERPLFPANGIAQYFTQKPEMAQINKERSNKLFVLLLKQSFFSDKTSSIPYSGVLYLG
jgi:hypothetical protein